MRVERLPWNALLALATTGLVMIMTETLPAGLLPQIAAGLGVGEGAAGQLVGAYAVGTVCVALPVVTATGHLRRKPLLLAGIVGFVLANAVTAVSPAYGLTLAARFVAGGFSGLLWGLIPGYARRLVPPSAAGRGLAVAGVGTPIALALGTPAGSFAGAVVSWRWVFAAMSVLALGLAVWVLLTVRDVAGQPGGTRIRVVQVIRLPGVAPVLVVVLAWMLAHNLLYTYVAPFLATTRTGARVDVVLLGFGAAALVGIVATGLLVDRALRALTLGALVAFAAAALVLGLAADVPAVLYSAVAVWGLTFGGASTLLNTAVADAAGPHTDVVATLVSTVWNAAIFGGSALGATLLVSGGARLLPWAVLPLALAATVVAAVARGAAFVPGARASRPAA